MKRLMKAALIMAALVLILPAAKVSANTYTGKSNWAVTFTKDKKMQSNFKTSELDEVVQGLQPGDQAHISVKLTNQNPSTTDWYMTNKVLYSLEDRSKNSGTAGGAYTYRLVYTSPKGTQRVLYDSETVGGDDKSPAGEGLKEATDALKDYFYLDELTKGKAGKIDLTVALDGETQGNDYQDTLADLQMNFAVELSDENGTSTTTSTSTSTTSTTSTSTRGTVVKTGDDNNLVPYYIAAGISGFILLFYAIFTVKRRRKDKEGGAA